MSRSVKLSLALLLLAALVVRWWGVDSVDVGTDEPSYTLNGDIFIKALLSGELYEKTRDLKKEHPPVANWLYVLAFQAQRLGWQGFFFYRAPKRLAGLLMVAAGLVVFLIGRRLWDDWTGLLAAALLAFLPHSLAHSRIAGLEAPSVLAWAGGLYCFVRAVEPGAGWRWLALLGLVLGLGVGVKMTNGLMALAGLSSLVILWVKQDRGLLRPARWWPWLLVPAVGLLAFWAA
jgi:4-amino-4-deoxy-L-arabinose transferase-like glycosyltransferase